MGKEHIELVPGYLNHDLVVKIYFRFNLTIKEIIKSLPGRRWSQEFRYWYISKQNFNLTIFIKKLEVYAEIGFSALEAFDQGEYTPTHDLESLPEKEDPIKRFEENHQRPEIQLPPEYLEKLIRKHYSPNTIKTYTTYMRSFIEEFSRRKLDTITTQEINDYILKLIRTKRISPSQQNQRINAIKFYYEKVAGLDKKLYYLA